MVEVFFSYSHQDEGLRNELVKHLSLTRRQGVIDIWSDHRIGPGGELGGGNSYNESLSIEDDGFSLFLKPFGMARMGQDNDKQLTPEGTENYYWSLFVERLQ